MFYSRLRSLISREKAMSILSITPRCFMNAMILNRFFGLCLLFNISAFYATENSFRDCIILIDVRNWEGSSRPNRCYLMSRFQSAIAEQAVPILINASLWNSFIERRMSTEQLIKVPDSRAQKVYELYVRLNERIKYWSDYYNGISPDAAHNKTLVVHQINKEFYTIPDRLSIGIGEYNLLLNHEVQFDPEEWLIYKNSGGFYLFIPKKYHAEHEQPGFRLEALEKVVSPLDNGCIYFESQSDQSLVDALPDFFLTHDLNDLKSSYTWNIILSGHGGSEYQEFSDNGQITWKGEPIIANLSCEEFNGVLAFFDEQVKTNFVHYTSCDAGGNHSKLIFGNDGRKTYNFALICGTLTDCISYCKWAVPLPSRYKRFLTCDDLKYDKTQKSWRLPLAFAYRWKYFFKHIARVDFSQGSIEHLLHILPAITHSSIADIPLLCLPHTQTFYPLYGSQIAKIDSQLLDAAEQQKESSQILLQGKKVLLVQSSSITPTIILEHVAACRIISVQPGNALHYIQKLKASFHVDLPTAFWQADYQKFNKTFILDECTFSNDRNSYIFKQLGISDNELILKNVIILQQAYSGMRVFFTVNDQSVMVLARKADEENEAATVLSVTQLSAAAKKTYNEYYDILKQKISSGSDTLL